MNCRIVALSVVVVMSSTPCLSASPQDSETKAAMGALAMAKLLYKKGQYKKAAELFHQAFAVKPIPGFLFNAARAEQRAYMLGEAARDYARLLKFKTLNVKTAERARYHLREVTEAKAHIARLKTTKPSDGNPGKPATPAPTESTVKPGQLASTTRDSNAKSVASGSSWRGTAGIVSCVVGGVAMIGGGVLAAGANADQAALHGFKDASGKYDSARITLEAAKTQQESINDRYGYSVVAGAVGVAVVGAGIWMLVTRGTESVAQIGPAASGRGLSVSVAF